MAVLISDRRFQMWEFRVSHNQMLLRSPRSEHFGTNLDVVFVGVDYVELPTSLVGLRLEEGTAADLSSVPGFAEKPPRDARAFVINTASGRRHIVVAVNATVSENQLDLFDSGLEAFTP